MAMADASNLDLCGGQDKTDAVVNDDYKSDDGNQWQLPDITDPPSCFNQGRSVQQPLPETAFSQEVEVRIRFTFTVKRCGSRIFVSSSPAMIDRNYN